MKSVQDPAEFSSGTAMWAQEQLSGASRWPGPSMDQEMGRNVDSRILSRDCARSGPRLVQCRDHMWPHICLLILNMRRTNLGLRWNLGVGSGVLFRGFKKHRIQLGSIQGHRSALRSVVGVMHKGRTQPDSVHGPRGGPRNIYRKLGQQMYEGEC